MHYLTFLFSSKVCGLIFLCFLVVCHFKPTNPCFSRTTPSMVHSVWVLEDTLYKISTEGTKDVAHSQSFRDATEKKEGGSLAPGFRVRMGHTPVILCLSKEDVGTKAFVKERGEQLFLSLNVFAERCIFWKRGRREGGNGGVDGGGGGRGEEGALLVSGSLAQCL